jgi:glutathione synthase/RimK-type ligase-like ATP-grasp enzyme
MIPAETTRRPPRLALATCDAQPLLFGEERELLPALRARGVDAEAVIWSDPRVDWASFDAVVLRSTWDYFERYPEFCAWLARVESVTRVYNPPSLVRWNSDKMYLRELAQRGTRIVPTVFCEAREPANLARILRDSEWDDAVMKPCVSGGAYRTHRVRAETAAADQAEMNAILATTGVLVQPFFPEIQTEGEWSFVFFGGTLSHTVLKVAVRDEYRIQTQFGGTFSEVTPEPWLLAQVQGVVSALPEAPAYARIDGLVRGRDFYLMEAELIEPYLYLSAAPGSLERCADLIEMLVRRSPLSQPHA